MGYGCYCTAEGHRSFPTKEEKLQALKRYKESLDNESKGVSERIAELEDSE